MSSRYAALLALTWMCAFPARAATTADLAADEEDGEEVTTVSGAVEESGSNWGGWIDLRPSFTPSEGRVHSENEAALEYGWAEDRTVGYTQEFQTIAGDQDRQQFRLGEGYLWTELSQLVRFSRRFSLTYQPRVYLPTAAAAREAGRVVALAQYLKFAYRPRPGVELFLWEIPIVPLHKEAGYDAGDETLIANPAFENRIETGIKFTLFNGGMKIKVPFIWEAIRHRNFNDEAQHNARWTQTLWIAPEVLFKIVGGTYLGACYYSDSFLSAEEGHVDVKEGLRRGVAQVVFQQLL